MSTTHRQITAFRRPTTITYIYDPHGRNSFGSTLGSVATAIRMALEANEHWGDLERTLETILSVYMPRKGGGWGSERFKSYRADSAVEHGKLFEVELGAECLTLVPKKDLIMHVVQGYIDGTKTPSFTLVFTNPMEGAAVKEKLDKIDCLSLQEATWEQALYLKPWIPDHWVFSQGSEQRLGERLTRINKPGGYFRDGDFDYYRLATLLGETLVVYESEATRQLGISTSSKERIRHPDGQVFATVGPFALAFRARDPHDRKSRDRIAVFEDHRLPILPPDEDADERVDTDDDFEPDDGSFRWYGRKN